MKKSEGIAYGVAGVGFVVALIAAMSGSSSAASSKPAPNGGGGVPAGTTVQIKAGERYRVTWTANAPISKVISMADLQAELDAISGVQGPIFDVVAISQSGPQLLATVDAKRNATIDLSLIDNEIASTKIDDLGPTPPGSPGLPGLPGTGEFKRATVINPFDRVRASIAVADVQQLATSLGLQGPVDTTLFGALLTNPLVNSVLPMTSVKLYAPGPVPPPHVALPGHRPSDWPSDDTATDSEFSVEFSYPGSTALRVSGLPLPLLVWTAAAMGIIQIPAPLTVIAGAQPDVTLKVGQTLGFVLPTLSNLQWKIQQPGTSQLSQILTIGAIQQNSTGHTIVSIVGKAPGFVPFVWGAEDGSGNVSSSFPLNVTVVS